MPADDRADGVSLIRSGRPGWPRWGRYALLTMVAIVVLFPIWVMLVASLKPGNEVLTHPLLPTSLTLDTLRDAWHDGNLGRALWNSTVVAVIVTVAQVLTAVLSAYVFAFLQFPGRTFLFGVFLATLLVPFEATVVVNRSIMQDLGWLNSYQGLAVPFLATAFSTFLIRQAFMSLPTELLDAARMDGLGHLGFLREVAVPLVRPTIGALAVFAFLSTWNQYLWPTLVSTEGNWNTVQSSLKAMSQASIDRPNLVIAGTVIVFVPMAVVLLAFQRQLVRGVDRRRGEGVRRPVAAPLLAAVLLAGCGSGESILQAGNEAPPSPPPTTQPPPTVPGQTTIPPASTTPPTTVPRPIDSLPPCDVDVLDQASASGPVDLLFWHGLSNENGRTMEQVVEQYNQSQDRVHVSLEFQGGYEQTIDKYLQSNTDNRPDLVQMPEYATQLMIDTHSSVPMQSCMEDAAYDSSALLPNVLDAYASEGIQWSMPFNLSNPVLYYNKKIFRDAGLDPDKPPLTLAEVSEYGRTIQQTGAAAYGLVLDTAPDGGGGWYLEQWLAKEAQFYSDNDNGRSAPSTKVLFEGPVGVDLLTELRDVVTTGGGVYVGENPSGQDALLKLADSSAAGTMTISTSAGLGPVLAFVEGGIIAGIGPEDIGVGPMPSPNGAPGALIGGNSLWITAGRGDEKAAAAWDFTAWLLTAELQSQFVSATGYVPVNTGALDVEPLHSLYTSDPWFKVAFDQVAQTPDVPTSNGPIMGPMREVRVIAAAAMGRILNGGDPTAELATAAGEANALITDYNSRRDAGG